MIVRGRTGRYIKRYLDFWISGYYSISPLAICDGGYFLFIGKPNKHFFTQDLVHIHTKDFLFQVKLSVLVTNIDVAFFVSRTNQARKGPWQQHCAG